MLSARFSGALIDAFFKPELVKIMQNYKTGYGICD